MEIEKANALLWEVSFWEFLFVTIMLAGAAAYLTGRAVAQSWLTIGHLVLYMVLLTAATRFIHFALFDGTLLTIQYFIVDFVALLAVAYAGMRLTRTRQMAQQYRFRKRTAETATSQPG